MDLIKISKRFAQFLNNDIQSLTDIYTHLKSDVFLRQITDSMSAIDIIKVVFLTKTILDDNDPVRLNEVLEQNLYIFSIIEFGGDPELECNNCSGGGNVSCDYCDGSGNIQCDKCDGRGDIDCDKCDGSGIESEDEEEIKKCPSCDGSGSQSCPDCSGEGEETCGHCDGSGNEECDYCYGTGYERQDGANYDIEMFASYNPILKNSLEQKYVENSQIDSSKIERVQTFLFSTHSVTDSDENTNINTDYQHESFVNSIVTDPGEFDFLRKNKNNNITFNDFEDANDKFMY